MRIIELGAWRIPVSNEENMLLVKIKDSDGKISKSQLSSRETVLAKNLVAKGVLTRVREADKLYYTLEDSSSQWRL